MKPLTGRFVLVVVLLFFGTVLTVNIVMMRYAISTMPGVDVDSAYNASLSYGKEIANAHRQNERDWTVEAHIERESDGGTSIQIEARDPRGKPITDLMVQCRLERPADRRADLTLAMSSGGNGVYRGSVPTIAPGQWDLVIEGRAADQLMFVSKNRVILDHD